MSTPTTTPSSSSDQSANAVDADMDADADTTVPTLMEEPGANNAATNSADDGALKLEDQLPSNSSTHSKASTFLPLIDETMTDDGNNNMSNSNLSLQQNGIIPSPLGMSPTPLSDDNMAGCVVPPNTPALLSIPMARTDGVNGNQMQLDGDGASTSSNISLVGSDLVAAVAKKVHAANNLRHSAPSNTNACASASANQKPPPSTASLSRRRASVPPVISSSHIRLGICAMDKKARSKPMSEILSRLDSTLFNLVFFGDDVILNQSIDDWPEVDVLIAFYSSGYPLEKAEDYVAKYEPFVLNDLGMQHTLMDRRKVYDLMEENGIHVPRHVYVSRDGYVCKTTGAGTEQKELEEHDDFITVNGVTIEKPFVEKPVDADDHNIRIYYPQSAGGGSKWLFRKIGDRSSEFYPGAYNATFATLALFHFYIFFR